MLVRCISCQKEFTPNKYHPQQRVCPEAECQRKRQIQNMQEWRLRNPDYFKYIQETAWREKRQRYSKLWKSTHKAQLRKYAKTHQFEHREYMREYMRRYRKIKKS